jgi:phage baseplate assembly protein W
LAEEKTSAEEKIMTGRSFIGSGWRFPVGIAHGEAALAQEEEDVRQAIVLILSTAPGERVMRPDFGCGIHDLVFSLNNNARAGEVRFLVEDSLRRWEPRIDVIEVSAVPDRANARLLIHVDYRLKSVNSRFNLVYPFYLLRTGS